MYCGTFLQVQWLGLQASTAGGIGSTLGQGTKILHATQPKKKREKRENTLTGYSGLCHLGCPPT